MAHKPSRDDITITARTRWNTNSNRPHITLTTDHDHYYLTPTEARRLADQLHDAADTYEKKRGTRQ